MTPDPPPPGTAPTEDTFLGGRLSVLQPRNGYRAGIDAVLLAAAVPLHPGTKANVLDCGAGVGTVGLCLAARCRSAHVTLVEREAVLARLARENISRNDLQDRVRIVTGDLTAAAQSPGAPGLAADSFDWVLANPPFHDTTGGTRALDHLKSVSHAMDRASLDLWTRFAARMARPGGRVLLIHKAAALPALFEALDGRFGGLAVRPVHPRDGAPAIRVLVEGIKGSRAEMSLLPGLVLHEADGAFTPYVSRILRQGAGLDEVLGCLPGKAPPEVD